MFYRSESCLHVPIRESCREYFLYFYFMRKILVEVYKEFIHYHYMGINFNKFESFRFFLKFETFQHTFPVVKRFLRCLRTSSYLGKLFQRPVNYKISEISRLQKWRETKLIYNLTNVLLLQNFTFYCMLFSSVTIRYNNNNINDRFLQNIYLFIYYKYYISHLFLHIYK